MTLLVIRHTHAGDRSAWAGDDRLRPLSPKGKAQANALVDLLSDMPIERLVSSPYVRCVQSVEPLAAARGLTLETDDRLAEGTPHQRLWTLLDELDGQHAAVCSHGDIVQDVVEALDLEPARWKKGSTWILERHDGLVTNARYLPPPSE